MDELTDIFSSEVTTRVYVIFSLVFVLLYVGGFLLLRGWPHLRKPQPIISRHAIPGLGVALVVGAIAFGFHTAFINKTAAVGVQSTVTISPDELQRQIEMNTLPVLAMGNPI